MTRVRLDCDEVRVRLALGEDVRAAAVARHLSGCEACAKEAARFREMLGALAMTAEAEPSEAVDRRVRAMLEPVPDRRGPVLRPVPALGLSVAALLALGACVAGGLAQAGAAERGPVLAAVAVSIYLALSSTAALPVLLSFRLARPAGRPEVRS